MAKVKESKDLEGWGKAKEVAGNLVTKYTKLREGQRLCELAYFLEWEEEPSGKIKATINPDPYNKVTGATRLMALTSPTFNVPRNKNDLSAGGKSSTIEKIANTAWMRSNAIQETSVERDLAHCGFLYDEMHLRIISTRDILKRVQKAYDEAKPKDKERWQAELDHARDVADRTPFLFEPILPTCAYSMRGVTGLEVHYTKVDTLASNVRGVWGDYASSLAGMKDYESVTLHTFIDRHYEYVWIEGEKEPIFAEPHGLSFIPVAVYVPYGISVHTKPERSHMPMLYPVIKSGIWQRQNLFLTVTATNAAALMNAQFIASRSSPEDKIEIDHSVIGGVAYEAPGMNLRPMAKEIVNPDLMHLAAMYDNLMDESTVFNQTLGEPIAGNQTYSLAALLHQAGRLPLSPVQAGMSRLLAKAMEIAFKWMRQEGSVTIRAENADFELKQADIPERIEFDVVVDVDLPQDKLQQANTGATIVASELASKEWTRENILNIGQSDDEQKQIWREKMSDMASGMVFEMFLKQMLTPPQPPPSGMPPGGQQGPPGQMQPEGPPMPGGQPMQGGQPSQGTRLGMQGPPGGMPGTEAPMQPTMPPTPGEGMV